jgi:hypothetical protein
MRRGFPRRIIDFLALAVATAAGAEVETAAVTGVST